MGYLLSSASELLPPFRRIIFVCVTYIVHFYIAVDTLTISGVPLSKWLNLTGRKRKKAGRGKLERALLCFISRDWSIILGKLPKHTGKKSRSLAK